MSAHTTQMDDLRLVAQPTAIPCAELFVRVILADWSLLPMLDQVTAATGRLVGAVVDEGSPSDPAFLTVRLRLRQDALVIEVDDDLPDPAPPRSRRGERVGVVPNAAGGRTTWCELPLPGGLNAGEVRLPHRKERRTLVDEPVTGEPVAADPAVLERLLDRMGNWSS